MVLTAAQTTAFFDNANQMDIPNATVVQLQNKGISTLDNLIDFDKDSLKQIEDNLRCPPDKIHYPNTAAGGGATIPMPAFTFGSKSQKRIWVACDVVCYYDE
eukprot:3130669-Ditylum_brightwellii.AAC.1